MPDVATLRRVLAIARLADENEDRFGLLTGSSSCAFACRAWCVLQAVGICKHCNGAVC